MTMTSCDQWSHVTGRFHEYIKEAIYRLMFSVHMMLPYLTGLFLTEKHTDTFLFFSVWVVQLINAPSSMDSLKT